MCYTLTKNQINFNHSISGITTELVNNFKDLGVMFDSKLIFSKHTEIIKNKANK